MTIEQQFAALGYRNIRVYHDHENDDVIVVADGHAFSHHVCDYTRDSLFLFQSTTAPDVTCHCPPDWWA